MTSAQLCFDFDGPAPRGAARPHFADIHSLDARECWIVGMVTSLPPFCEVRHSQQRYTYMLPGVIESITGELASVRIYAAPEYGYTLENYPLHLKLAINVPLRELGRYRHNDDLQRLADEGLLATGDAHLAAEVRARCAEFASTPEREIARVA